MQLSIADTTPTRLLLSKNKFSLLNVTSSAQNRIDIVSARLTLSLLLLIT